MTYARTVLLFLTVGLSSPVLADEPAQTALDAMQGTWTIESFTIEGHDLPASTIASWRRIGDGNHIVWKQGDETLFELDIQLDASKKPMMLDSTIVKGDVKGTMLAIFELVDDSLRVCFTSPGESRPAVFSSAPGSGLLMFTAKRLRP